jgi:hypothetical protein
MAADQAALKAGLGNDTGDERERSLVGSHGR